MKIMTNVNYYEYFDKLVAEKWGAFDTFFQSDSKVFQKITSDQCVSITKLEDKNIKVVKRTLLNYTPIKNGNQGIFKVDIKLKSVEIIETKPLYPS